MKRRDHLTDLKSQTVTDLVGLIKKSEQHLVELAFSSAFRKQKNVHEAHELRRQVARMKTILRQSIQQAAAAEVQQETR